MSLVGNNRQAVDGNSEIALSLEQKHYRRERKRQHLKKPDLWEMFTVTKILGEV